MVEDFKPEGREIESTLVGETDEARWPEPSLFQSAASPAKNVAPRDTSWTLYAVALLLVIIAGDVLLVTFGQRWFLSSRTIYVLSLVSRFVVIFIASQWQFVRRFSAQARVFYIVNAWTVLVAGLILAAGRFVDQQVFWTFINIAIEPLDGLLLALIASWLVIRIHKTLTKPKYADSKVYF